MKFCYEAVDEETLWIDLPDSNGLKVKAILRGRLDKPIVVMLHGLPGYANDLLQFLGARYLYEKGFATVRVYLYSWDRGTRDLADCTVQTHADDFDTVVAYIRSKSSQKIFATGHSYGGLTILKARTKLNGAVLWDPSHGLVFRDSEQIKYYDRNIQTTDRFKLYLSGPGYIEPLAITNEQEEMGDNSDWSANKNYPLKIISAGDGAMVKLHKKYIKAADSPKAHTVIAGAHHAFEDSDDVMLRLFDETASWFKEILKDE